MLRQIADSILNLVYPETCLVCASPVARHRDRGVCGICWKKALLLAIKPPFCPSCGIPFQHEEALTTLCAICSLTSPPYSGARSFGYYSAELRCMIQALKFEGKQDLANLFSPLLVSTFFRSWQREEMDLVIPVPLHPKRKREREFNQVAVLGRATARLIGLPYRENVLIRVRNTMPQVGLTLAERVKNVRHAFRCERPSAVHRQRVLLLDDVMTTGATVASACEALLEGGALRVSVLTLARAVHFD